MEESSQLRVKVRNRWEVSRAPHTCGLFYCFKWMCVFLAQGTAHLHLSTWRGLHVSPVPNYHICLKRLSENSKLSQAGALRGWVWSALAWRPRTVGCRMLRLWTRKGVGNGRWEHKGRGELCGLLMQSGASGATVLEPKHGDPGMPSEQAASRLLWLHGTGPLFLFRECPAFSHETRALTPLQYPCWGE